MRSVAPSYRLRVEFGAVPGLSAMYLPGVFAHARVAINGHVIADRIREPQPSAPRGANRLLLATVPGEFLRPGLNHIDVDMAGTRKTSLSRVWIGDEDALRSLYERKLLLTVHAPVAAAAIIMALSLCVLLLWARQTGDTLYAYFGVGGLVWALHTVWTVLPDPMLRAPHLSIWWTMGYPFFIAPLVVFCIRLAQWELPRFERALWIGVLIGPRAAVCGRIGRRAGNRPRLLAPGMDRRGGGRGGGRRPLRAAPAQRAGRAAAGHRRGGAVFRHARLAARPGPVGQPPGAPEQLLRAAVLSAGGLDPDRRLRRHRARTAPAQRRARAPRRQQERTTAARVNEMRAAKDAAEAADRAKSSFLAAASHDLRQPAHALGLYLAALRGETLNDAQAELVERMSDAAAALDTMFNALLDISRMDAGAVEVQRRPFELQPMLHRLAEEFAHEAADKGLRLSVRVSGAASGLRAYSDPMLVERIVRNLLGNAVKYTRTGGVLLACRKCGGATPGWRIQVHDTGPGIAEADRERVFEEFFQLEPSSRGVAFERSHDGGLDGGTDGGHRQGLGLGLSIVRRLSQLLGHAVSLKSRLGRGSCLTLELPATTDAAPVEVPAGRPAGALNGLCVGVIDDDAQVRAAMRSLLERWGCVVRSGENATELLADATALHAAAIPPPRLQALVVDYQLRDGRTGPQEIGAVRLACAAHLPALIVSGVSAPTRLAELHASGFEWLIKPVPPQRLRSWLIAALRGKAVHGGAAQTPTRREAARAAQQAAP